MVRGVEAIGFSIAPTSSRHSFARLISGERAVSGG
jgi:hypothetical protein